MNDLHKEWAFFHDGTISPNYVTYLRNAKKRLPSIQEKMVIQMPGVVDPKVERVAKLSAAHKF